VQLDRIDLADIHEPERLADTLHGQLALTQGPVPVGEIALALGISEVREAPLEGVEGMLLTDERRSLGAILANNRGGRRRLRFTIAHELGHFLMEHHKLSSPAGFTCQAADLRATREGRRHLRQEAEANRFAIGLLAPRSLVMPLLSPDPDLDDARRLRTALDISREAAVRHLVETRDDCLAAVWSKDGRIRYAIRGQGFPYVTSRSGQSLPQATAAHCVHLNGKTGITGWCETPSIAWTNESDIELYEQSWRSPSGHAVTLLWAEMPDHEDDAEDDSSQRERDLPGFR
jgi:hypothetical protein